MTNELKPCPFCGRKAKPIKWVDGGNVVFGVQCTNIICIAFDIKPQYETEKSANEAWNRRCNDGT